MILLKILNLVNSPSTLSTISLRNKHIIFQKKKIPSGTVISQIQSKQLHKITHYSKPIKSICTGDHDSGSVFRYKSDCCAYTARNGELQRISIGDSDEPAGAVEVAEEFGSNLWFSSSIQQGLQRDQILLREEG